MYEVIAQAAAQAGGAADGIPGWVPPGVGGIFLAAAMAWLRSVLQGQAAYKDQGEGWTSIVEEQNKVITRKNDELREKNTEILSVNQLLEKSNHDRDAARYERDQQKIESERLRYELERERRRGNPRTGGPNG